MLSSPASLLVAGTEKLVPVYLSIVNLSVEPLLVVGFKLVSQLQLLQKFDFIYNIKLIHHKTYLAEHRVDTVVHGFEVCQFLVLWLLLTPVVSPVVEPVHC